MKNIIKSRFVQGALVALALVATPAVAVASTTFNTASNDLGTVLVSNATNNPNSYAISSWTPTVSAQGGQMVSVQVYYHNTGAEPAQNTYVKMSLPNMLGQTTAQISGSVSAANASTVSGTATVTFSDGQGHIFEPTGAVRWYPDQPSSDNRLPRPLLNGQTGAELFTAQGLNVGTVGVNEANGLWTYSQGTVVADFWVSVATQQNTCPASVTINQPTGITQTYANFSANLGNTPSGSYQSWFEWTGPSTGQTVTQTRSGNSFTDSTGNLTANSTYNVRAAVRSTDSTCGQTIIYSNYVSFQTLQNPVSNVCPVSLNINYPTGITQTGANFSATLGNLPSGSYQSWFEWTGPTTGQTITQTRSGSTFSDYTNNLTANGSYSVRTAVRSTDPLCNQGIIYSSYSYFQTLQNPVTNICPVSVTTNYPTGITQTYANFSATLGNLPTGSYQSWFEWTGASTGQTTTQTRSGSTYSDSTGNLTANSTYNVRAAVRSTDSTCSQGIIYGAYIPFSTTYIQQNNATLSVTTQGASGLSQNGATLNGYVNSSNATNVSNWYEYGTTISMGQTTYPQYTVNGSYSAQVYNLQPATTYYFRAVARSNENSTVYGAILTFQTPATYVYTYQQQASLSATTNAATGVSQNGATLNGYITVNSANNVVRWFEYGMTYSLGQRTSDQYQSYSSGNYSDSVYNLQPGVLYYFRAAARSNETGTVYGSIMSFSTITNYVQTYYQPAQPGVVTNPATLVTTSSARLNASATMNYVQANGWFEWGPTPSLGQQTSPLNLGSSAANTYFTTITGLSPKTLYYFRAVTRNAQGQPAYGQTLTFTTSAPAAVYVPPVVTYVPPKTVVTVAAATYTQVKSGEVITKTVDDLSFPCGTKTYVCAREGHTIQYTITVMNPSWSATSDAVITDTLSPFLDFKSASEGGSYNAGTRLVQWSRQLGPREGHTFTIQVIARNIADNINVVNNAQINVGGKTYKSNDTQVCITIDPVKVEVASDHATAQPGDTVTYTVNYRNADGAPVQGLTLRMSVPQGTTFVGSDHPALTAEGGVVTMPVGTLNPKQSGIVTVTVKIDPKISLGTPIVFAVTASFQDLQGVPQTDVVVYTTTPLAKTGTPLSSASVAAAGTGTFLPTTLLGWFAFLILLLIAILVITRVWKDYKESKPKPPESI